MTDNETKGTRFDVIGHDITATLAIEAGRVTSEGLSRVLDEIAAIESARHSSYHHGLWDHLRSLVANLN